MGALHDAFQQELEKLPHRAVREVVAEKLRAHGLDNDKLTDQITEHLFKGEGDFVWDGAADVTIEFNEKDMEEVDRRCQKVIDSIPEMVGDLTRELGDGVLSGLRNQWRDMQGAAREEVAGFRTRLQIRWREGLDGLRMLAEFSRDRGMEFQEKHLRSRRSKDRARNQALMQLHLRSCQVVDEIIVLLESGYPKGAMARWRTLFEIATVATMIADAGDLLAERYLDHDIVDRKRSMEEYQRCAADLGEPPIPARERAAIMKTYKTTLLKHGPEFGNSFGWAAGFVGRNPNPKFNHLQEAAGQSAKRIYYKLASFGVHAGAGAFDQQLGSFKHDMLHGAASNGGLEQPGANTAFTITHLVGLLFHSTGIDELTMLQTFIQLRDETVAAFFKAADNLEREERAEMRKAMRRPARRWSGRLR